VLGCPDVFLVLRWCIARQGSTEEYDSYDKLFHNVWGSRLNCGKLLLFLGGKASMKFFIGSVKSKETGGGEPISESRMEYRRACILIFCAVQVARTREFDLIRWWRSKTCHFHYCARASMLVCFVFTASTELYKTGEN
jgi:hypothetical protein